MTRRILVVEDDDAFSHVLCHHLTSKGFDVHAVADGDKAFNAAITFAPDLVLLDLMLPDTSGLDLCAAWRNTRRFPIIMITSRDSKMDQLRGFQAGADDYVTKPFDLEMLVARINAVLRRARPRLDGVQLGAVILDFINMTARRGRQAIHLTHREFQILMYLVEHANTIVSREDLLRDVWGYQGEPQTRSVDMAMIRLRRKLEADPQHPAFLRAARGGYLLVVDTRA